MATGLKWEYDTISSGLPQLSQKVKAALLMYAKTKAETYKAQMKMKRPWTDRTNMAKTMLDANVVDSPGKITLVLSHGVEYGVWLELAHNKRYAILKPTIDSEANSYFAGMNNLFNKIKVF